MVSVSRLGRAGAYTFQAAAGTLTIESIGEFAIQQRVKTITMLGVQKPMQVTLDEPVQGWTWDEATEALVVSDVSVDLNGEVTSAWK
jgi:alpha-glucosidase